jgi:tetratricopeptide (TPR) repeat protein
MISPVSEMEYIGAQVTPELINREEILGQIHQAILGRPAPYVFYITAPGGMGKTFLLRKVLRRCREGGEWAEPGLRLLAGEDVVDLYHFQTHSMEGLARAIRAVLRPGPGYFARYEWQLKRFERDKYDLAGMLSELSKLRDDVAKAFLEDLNRLAESYRVILALDTAEKLLYETDKVQKALGLKEPGIAIHRWLLEDLLPNLQNVIVLIAGRPRPERLREDLREALKGRLVEYELGRFEKEGASAYFDAVARAARDSGQAKVADFIEGIAPDTREVIWLYTAGRPILLSLMIDYLVVADRLLPEVKDPVAEARRKTEDELKAVQSEIEADLVRLLQETGRRADEVIRSLAWAPKGMDAALLARVADISEGEAESALAELRGLSFVKVPPADKRVFLHDEMYTLLQRHVLAHLPEVRKERVYSAILAYYKEQIKQARAEVERLQRPGYQEADWEREPVPVGRPKPPADPTALAEATARLYTLMAEEVYYHSRKDPADGYQTYCRYAGEAFWASTESETLDMQLRSEMLDYLEERKGEEQFNGLSRSDLEIDAALRWIDRCLIRAQYGKAVEVADRLRRELAELLAKGGPLTRPQLDIFEGEALACQGAEFGRAERLLRSAIESFQNFQPENDFQSWHRDTLLARAFSALGYLYRVTGRFPAAIAEYRRALPLWRVLKMEAQQATTLNNLAWAYAQVGDFQHALRHCRDALELRQELGPRAPVAFSLNTMGLVQIYADQPDRARVNCERALGIFRDLEQPRGVGMACAALSEALRRMSTGTPELYTPEESADLLRRAREHASEAVDIFTNTIREHPRLIQALIELGCVYRDWANIRNKNEGPDPDRSALASKGEEALRRAIREAAEEEELLYLVVNAQVNLAWLYHYVDDDEKAHHELKEAIDRTPREYYIEQGRGLPKRDLPTAYFWVQLGKAHLLYGQIAMRKFQDSKDLEHLREAARHYTLSLAYDQFYAPDFRDMRRGTERIYNNLKGLNVQVEFPAVYEEVDKVAKEYKLETPTLMDKFLFDSFGPLEVLDIRGS